MKSWVYRSISVAAVLTAVAVSPLYAQEQLRSDAITELEKQNMDVGDVDSLTDAQLAQMLAVLRSTESEQYKRSEVQRLSEAEVPCMANEQLRADVESQLQQLGMTDISMDELTGQQVSEMHLVLSCDECTKQERIQNIVATDPEMAESDQLRSQVRGCLVRLGVRTDNLQALTPQEIAEIELVLGSGDTDAAKRTEISQILGE